MDEDKEEFIAILERWTRNWQSLRKESISSLKRYVSIYPSYFAYFPARVLNNCVLLPIEAESQNTALRIFSTLNDRGKPLSLMQIFLRRNFINIIHRLVDEFIETWI